MDSSIPGSHEGILDTKGFAARTPTRVNADESSP